MFDWCILLCFIHVVRKVCDLTMADMIFSSTPPLSSMPDTLTLPMNITLPTISTPLPSSSTQVPSTSKPLPSSSTQVPSTSKPLLYSITQVPSTSTPTPSSITQVPSTSTPTPSTKTPYRKRLRRRNLMTLWTLIPAVCTICQMYCHIVYNMLNSQKILSVWYMPFCIDIAYL